jgi:hypothetical protein
MPWSYFLVPRSDRVTEKMKTEATLLHVSRLYFYQKKVIGKCYASSSTLLKRRKKARDHGLLCTMEF